MTTQTTERRKEAICPPWCAGHDDRYQAWEELADESGRIREHGERGTQHGAADVYLNETETDDHRMQGPKVCLDVDADLNLDDAEALAKTILAAVSRAQQWNAFSLGRDYERGLHK